MEYYLSNNSYTVTTKQDRTMPNNSYNSMPYNSESCNIENVEDIGNFEKSSNFAGEEVSEVSKILKVLQLNLFKILAVLTKESQLSSFRITFTKMLHQRSNLRSLDVKFHPVKRRLRNT